MNSKERLIAALSNKTPDQVPWSNLITKYFLFSQKKKYRDLEPVDFLMEIGADATPWIGSKTKSKNVRVTTYIDGKKYKIVDDNWLDGMDFLSENYFRGNNKRTVKKVFEGFGGRLTSKYIYKSDARTVFLTEFMIKGIKDYDIFQKMIRDIEYQDITEDYEILRNKLGNNGLPFIVLDGSPSIKLIEDFMGPEKFIYNLIDHKEETANLLNIMEKKYKHCYAFYSKMPAEVINTAEDTGTIVYSPQIFNDYIKPVLRDYSDIVKNAGKIHITHSCGHLKSLIPMLGDIGTDCLESVTPPPIGSVGIKDLKDKLKGVCIMGGIPADVFSYPLSEFKNYVRDLILEAKGSGSFILSSGDSTPPEAKVDNLKVIPELINRYGKYGI